MLNKFFAKPIELEVGDQTLKFHSLVDFEFALNGRTSIPSKKISDLVGFTVQQLKKEAHTIKEVEKKFVSILSQSIEEPESIERAIRELDPLIFSQDHGWREIIGALNNSDSDLNEFRRMALVKYMQYLSSRQDIIKYLYSEKNKITPELIRDADAGDEMENLRTTVVLDSTLIAESANKDETTGGEQMERLPKGEVVDVQLMPGKEINLVLSKHKCKLVGGEQMEFIDQTGKHHPLQEGRNVIGRDAVSNIVLDTSLRDISRLHLVVEKLEANRITLTDLSSHGTYMPVKYIQEHSNTV